MEDCTTDQKIYKPEVLTDKLIFSQQYSRHTQSQVTQHRHLALNCQANSSLRSITPNIEGQRPLSYSYQHRLLSLLKSTMPFVPPTLTYSCPTNSSAPMQIHLRISSPHSQRSVKPVKVFKDKGQEVCCGQVG